MLTTAALATCLLLAQSPADTWPGFRGTGDNTSAATNVPLTWGEDKNVAWSVDLPGHGQSAPVVYDGQVYVASVIGDNKQTLALTAYALADGKQLWTKQAESSTPEKRTDYVSFGASTPCVDEHGVYAFFESGDLLAFDHSGKPLWTRKFTAEYGAIEGNHGLGTSLAQSADRLILLVDHSGPSYLVALDKATGQNLWKIDRKPRVSWSSPVVSGDRVVVSSNGAVQVYGLADGKLLWQAEGIDGNNVPSPTATEKLVVVGASAQGSNLALPLDGTGDVKLDAATWVAKGATSSFGSPLVYQDRVYFVSRAGVAFCVELATGKSLWQERVSASCWASPLGAAGRVYFFSNDGTTTVFAAGDEAKKLATNELPTNSRVYGAAAVENNLLIREEQKLTCVRSGD